MNDTLQEIKLEYENYLDGLEENQKAYITYRLIKQIGWYDCAAVKYKKYFTILTMLSILLTGILPCLTTFHVKSPIIAVISTASAISNTLINALGYHNLWIEYRMICERLRSTLHQYLTGTGIFSAIPKDKQFNLLVELSEECMSKELKSWNAINNSKDKTEDTAQG